MSKSIKHPAHVPAAARWVDADQEWALGQVDDEGEKHGPYAYYRPDGTLCNLVFYFHGTPQEVAMRFHENGEISQKCNFEDGQLTGEHYYIRTKTQTTEVFFPGISPNIKSVMHNHDNDEMRFWNWDDEEVDVQGQKLAKTHKKKKQSA